MFGGMLLAAWAGGFQDITVWVIVVLAVLTLVVLGIDLLATLLGARRVGASKKALLGAALGTFAGLFFGIPGLLVGPFAGAVIGELIHGREWRAASKIGFGAWLGLALGAALKLALAACRTLGVESENRPQRGQFLPDLQAHSPAMGQKDGEKWTAAVDLQPTIPKSDRLLAFAMLGIFVIALWVK